MSEPHMHPADLGANPTVVVPSLIALPMHGNHKMLTEGYRTRDAHLIEWFGRLNRTLGPVEVVSRPEPMVKRVINSTGAKQSQAFNTVDNQRYVYSIPDLRDRRKWWVKSASKYPNVVAGQTAPAVIWNPFVAVSNISDRIFNGQRKTIMDLLDDWTIHYAFDSVRSSVEQAYRLAFENADLVTANSEGTVELAHRFGRSDVHLVANGVDPDRFSEESLASGNMTVGYLGKIGRRVDLELIISVAHALPDVSFVMAGPILDAEYRAPLSRMANIRMLGDVRYDLVPDLLQTFDIGWVPHRVGEFEVGGDVIKTYEYRAAGLPVLSTPVIGAGDRGLTGVDVLDGSKHLGWLQEKRARGHRVHRISEGLPDEHSWEFKAKSLMKMLESA